MKTRKLSILNLATVAAILLVSATILVLVGAANIGVTGFQTPPMSDFVPSIAATGFRTPLMSDIVPSIAVTGFRTPPYSNFVPLAPSISVTGFRTPPISDFIPSPVVVGATAADEPYPSPYPSPYPVNYSPSSVVAGATANDEPYPSPFPANYIVPSNAGTNFRIAHKWNGIFIPSMDVTSLLALPATGSSSSTDVNLRTGPIFVPSLDIRLARLDALELQKDLLPLSLQDVRLARIDALELQKDVIP